MKIRNSNGKSADKQLEEMLLEGIQLFTFRLSVHCLTATAVVECLL